MLTTSFELADGNEVEAAVNFEAVTSIPVTTFLDQSDNESQRGINANKDATLLLRLLQLCRNEIVIAKEESNPDKSENDVYSSAESGGLLKSHFLRIDGTILNCFSSTLGNYH